MRMFLSTAIESGMVQEGEYFLCEFPQNEVKLTQKNTGEREEQTIHTEKLDMYLCIIGDKLYLISDNGTEKHLRLNGGAAVERRSATMKMIADELYKNPEIFSDVFVINRNIQKGMKGSYANVSRWYWLDEGYSAGWPGHLIEGILYVEQGEIKPCKLRFGNSSCNWASMSIRIGGLLRPNLMVIGGKGTKKEPWILKANS